MKWYWETSLVSSIVFTLAALRVMSCHEVEGLPGLLLKRSSVCSSSGVPSLALTMHESHK